MSEVLRAHRDREERPVTRVELDLLASRDPQVQMEAQVPKDHWVILVHKVQVDMRDHLAHQDPREALDSLVSKDSWEMLVFLDLKEKLDPKESLVHQGHRE